MNFREFYLLNEANTYILMKSKWGQYQVIGPKAVKDLPMAMANEQQANNPLGMWTYAISGGKLHLPPELEKDRENILMAHYSRMGLDIPASAGERDEEKQDFTDIIDPSVFNPNYDQDHAYWRQYRNSQRMGMMPQKIMGIQNQDQTSSFRGNPLSGGMPTRAHG